MNKIKEKIVPYLKMDIDKSKHKYIDGLFEEMYLVEENGKEMLCIRSPEAEYLALRYNLLNGASEGIDYWEVVQKEGKRV